MAYTLSQLRSRVQAKLNNVGSGETVLFQPAEIDNNINAGIKLVGHLGEISLIQRNLYKQDDLAVSASKITKPTDFFRFDWARVDNRRGRILNPEEYDDFVLDDYRAPGNKNKYLIDYDGTTFLVLPDSSSSVDFHYIATLTDLSDDTDTSPLTNVGDDYAVDWGFALCLESKGFKPDIAQSVFARVMGILQIGKVTTAGPGVKGPSGPGGGIKPPPPVT